MSGSRLLASFFEPKQPRVCGSNRIGWIYIPWASGPRMLVTVANEALGWGVPNLNMSCHPGGDEPASWGGEVDLTSGNHDSRYHQKNLGT